MMCVGVVFRLLGGLFCNYLIWNLLSFLDLQISFSLLYGDLQLWEFFVLFAQSSSASFHSVLFLGLQLHTFQAVCLCSKGL